MTPPWYDRLVGASPADSAGSRREVLVIDDTPEARETIVMSLQHLGWAVKEASSGREAMAVMDTSAAAVGLALVDVVLPDIDGLSLARELHARYPRLKVVLLSGQLNDESRWIVSAEGFKFLPKPCSLRELRDAVAEMLGDVEPPSPV